MYQKILVPLDGSEIAESVLPHAQAIAESFKAESVTLVRVLERIHMPRVEGDAAISEEEWASQESGHDSEAREYLNKLVKTIKWGGLTKVEAVTLPPGDSAERILKFASEKHMDMIIIATHGRSGVVRWFLGSVAEKILRSSPIPVLTVRVPGFHTQHSS